MTCVSGSKQVRRCTLAQLATIRTALLRDPKPLRRVLEAKEFAKLFGEAKPEKGKRTNVFGRDDELKNVRHTLESVRTVCERRTGAQAAWRRQDTQGHRPAQVCVPLHT